MEREREGGRKRKNVEKERADREKQGNKFSNNKKGIGKNFEQGKEEMCSGKKEWYDLAIVQVTSKGVLGEN